MSTYPRMMYGPGTATRVVHTAEDEVTSRELGYSTDPTEAHRAPVRAETRAEASGAPALSEAHIPLIVDALFDRLKGVATEDAVRGELAKSVATLKADILGEMRALIAPTTPAAAKPR